MTIRAVLSRWFLFKARAVAVRRCAECDLPLGLPGMGPTLESASGPVHTLCVPTYVRAEGEAAVKAWLHPDGVWLGALDGAWLADLELLAKTSVPDRT